MASLTLVQIYKRALGLLAPEKYLAIGLAAAGVVIAATQLAEPILFGRVVDALSKGENAFGYIGLWALLGLFGIVAGVIVGINADRLAHRQKQAHLVSVFERTIAFRNACMPRADQEQPSAPSSPEPARYSGCGSARCAIRLARSSASFCSFRPPSAWTRGWRRSCLPLAAAYTLMNVFVMRKTSAGQAAVESHESALSSRVVDVVGNVMIVQSYARLRLEADALREVSSDLLTAQYPVVTWWGVLTVMQRSAATLTMVAIFSAGAILAGRGELSVGEIVSFVAFASLLISRLDQLSGFVVRVHQQAPALTATFRVD